MNNQDGIKKIIKIIFGLSIKIVSLLIGLYTMRWLNTNLTPNELKSFSGHRDQINSLAFSSDNKTIITGSEDKTIIMWHIDSLKEIKIFTNHTCIQFDILNDIMLLFCITNNKNFEKKKVEVHVKKSNRTIENDDRI